MTDETAVEQPQEESRHDSIAAAFDKVEATETVTEEAATVETSEAAEDERARDDQGRFVSKDTETPADGDPPQDPPQREYFDSWRKGLEEHVQALPQEVYEEIARREQSIHDGLNTAKQHTDFYNEFNDALAPYMGTIESMGISPAEATKRLFHADHMLRAAPPSERTKLFHELAASYGVELPELPAEQQGSPEVRALQDEVHRLRHQLGSIQQTDQQQAKAAESEAHSHVQQFFAQNPDAEQHRAVMAGLIESGRANDLESAFDLAKRIDQDPVDLEAHREKVREELEREQKAKEAAALVNGSPAVTSPSVDTNDRRAAIEAALTAKM